MSLTQPVASDHQLARLLQIGMVLEEVVGVFALISVGEEGIDRARTHTDASVDALVKLEP